MSVCNFLRRILTSPDTFDPELPRSDTLRQSGPRQLAPEQGLEGQDAESPIWVPDRLIRPAPKEKEAEAEATEAAEAADSANEETESQPGKANDLDSSSLADATC